MISRIKTFVRQVNMTRGLLFSLTLHELTSSKQFHIKNSRVSSDFALSLFLSWT